MVGGSFRVLRLLPTKTGRHDIAEILLKVALKHQNSIFLFPLCGAVFFLFEFDLIFGVLMPLSAIFQLYHGDQFLLEEA
jgi:hypothetical protein